MLAFAPAILAAIEQLSLGNESKKYAACNVLYRHWHKNLAAYVVARFPGLSSDRVVNAVNDAFIELLAEAKKEDYFPGHPERLLFRIAQRRAIDELRCQTKRGKWRALTTDTTTELIEVSQSCRDQRTGVDQAADAEMMLTIREAIAIMPFRQRQVAKLMVEHCNGPVTAGDIQELARTTNDEYLTLPTANRSLEEVKKKLRVVLRSHRPITYTKFLSKYSTCNSTEKAHLNPKPSRLNHLQKKLLIG